MTASYDVAVIGGGHNALIAATLIAKAGRKTVVLERRDRVGGCAGTIELVPGFKCPALAHMAALDPQLVRRLELERHGLTMIRPAVDACAPTLDGRALVLWSDRARAVESIRAFSAKDAGEYPRFLDSFARIGGVLRALASTPPPDIDQPRAADVMPLLQAGRQFRALGKADTYRMLRWMPMPVADLVSEWFESEPLRATVAAGGVLGSFLGPRSAGSAAVLLMLGAGEGQPVGRGWFAQGGPGALAGALAAAARAAGVEIRNGVDVAQIDVDDDTATSVTLATGDRIPANAVLSGVDPKRTLLRMVDPMHLAPELIRRVQNIRTRGVLAKVNFAVSSRPRFSSLAHLNDRDQQDALSGRVRLAPHLDVIERAFDAVKYGGLSDDPWIELTIPSIADPSLAPSNQHVVSAYVQYVPYDTDRDRLADVATRTIARFAPGFESSIVAREAITPRDLECTYGLTGGQIFHGELAIDQFFVTRPVLGWARYATPIRRLFLCGSGTHPGTGLDGRSGANAAKQLLRDLS
jgi:phytoene dehydrogenase-like protein